MNQFVNKKIEKYLKKHTNLPNFFNPYNCSDCGDIAPTQTTCCNSTTSSATILKMEGDMNNLRIRKLTPKECWRLMGFDDEDFEKAKAVPTSNTQLYKQAGNSIVVNVIEEIYKCLFNL